MQIIILADTLLELPHRLRRCLQLLLIFVSARHHNILEVCFSIVLVLKQCLPLLIPLRNDTLPHRLLIEGHLELQRLIDFYQLLVLLRVLVVQSQLLRGLILCLRNAADHLAAFSAQDLHIRPLLHRHSHLIVLLAHVNDVAEIEHLLPIINRHLITTINFFLPLLRVFPEISEFNWIT